MGRAKEQELALALDLLVEGRAATVARRYRGIHDAIEARAREHR